MESRNTSEEDLVAIAIENDIMSHKKRDATLVHEARGFQFDPHTKCATALIL